MARRAALADLLDAVEDPAAWQAAVTAVADRLRAAGAGIGVQDMTTHAFESVAAARMDPAHSESYRRLARRNPVWEAIARNRRAMGDWMVMPRRIFEREPLYRLWFRPQGFTGVMAAPILLEGARCAVVVAFSGQRRMFGDRDLDALSGLAPLFARAVELRRERAEVRQAKILLAGILEERGEGLLLLGRDARLRWATPLAEAVLREGSALRLHNGRVVSRSRALTVELHLPVRETSARNAAASRWIPLPRPGRLPLLVRLLRLSSGSLLDEETAALWLRDPDRRVVPPPRLLGDLFGLTNAEIRTLQAVLATGSVPAAAMLLGRSPATVRTHLRDIYARLGVHNRTELLSLLAACGFVLPPGDR